MDNLSSSLILLIVALVLLWLAVTDRLSRVLDAVDVLRGKSTATTTGNTLTASVPGLPQLSLPSLPQFGQNAQVSI